MMRVNDNATRVLDKLISSGKVDDLGALRHNTSQFRGSEKLAHTLLINANDYGWSKIKTTTVGEALHIVAAMNPGQHQGSNEPASELAPGMGDDIAVISAALRVSGHKVVETNSQIFG